MRATRTVGGTTTSYVWDRADLLPLLVGDGVTDRVFLDNQVLEEVTGSARAYPLGDGLGSIRLGTDAAGGASGAVDYDAWGNVRQGAPGPLGWAGELRDATTGQVHLRARDYSPGTGRFTSRDTLIPNAAGTQGYAPYTYATNSPVTLTDPTGYFAVCAFCYPMAPGVAQGFQVQQAGLAARAPAEARSPVTARTWAMAGFALVAAILLCAVTPACKLLGSAIDGAQNAAWERAKQGVNDVLTMTALALTVAIVSVEVLLRLDRLRLDCTFKTFNGRNFRSNLACLTGRWDLYALKQVWEAHHVYPQEFKQEFESVLGFGTVHHPVYGAWVPTVQHILMHGPYNRWWREWWGKRSPSNPPSYSDVLAAGRQVMWEFKFLTVY